jgi:peptidyl-prolyl cis-trans isomerase SurA
LLHVTAQPLFTYGANEVSKDEFLRAFTKNFARVENKEKSMREYIDMYARFKQKVKAAKDMKLDTLDQVKYDMLNFRSRLEADFPIDAEEAKAKTGYKRNTLIKDEQLFQYADSMLLIPENRKYAIAKETLCTIGSGSVKIGEWLLYAKAHKNEINFYKKESYTLLLDKFINEAVTDYYRKHLEEYNPDFKYQVQEFKEGNLMFEVMGRKVWNKSAADPAALKNYFDNNKERFVWQQCVEVVLVQAKFYAYAEFAAENIKNGQSWKTIAANSEGMIQADSGRYELAQLPIAPGTVLEEGIVTAIIRNSDNSASFVKIIKVYPARMPRSFEEAKSMVANEYQHELESNWMDELAKKYPVKVNQAVFQSLLK